MIKGSVSVIYQTRVQEILTDSRNNVVVTGYIKELTPAGYSVDFKYQGVPLSGFMPNTLAGINKLYNPESIVGKTLELSVESYSNDNGTYIVSRKRYLQTLIPEEIKNLEYNNLYLGTVTGTTDFGVFVEFNGCLTGMIHKSNINPDYKISNINPGVGIEFYIKEIIKDKIILTQVLKESKWDTITEGQTLTGIVRDTKQFGTLISLDEETIGVIYNSEMEKNPRTLTNGSKVKVKVLLVDRLNRKISLTLL